MTRSRRSFALALLCLCWSGASVAQEVAPPAVGALQGAGTQGGAGGGQTAEAPSRITADRIEGETDVATRAIGNAQFQKAETSLSADTLTYHPLEDEIVAEGNVRLAQPGVEVNGPYLKLRQSTQRGYFDSARYRILRVLENTGEASTPAPGLSIAFPALPPRESVIYGEAARIHFEGENQYRIEDGTFSTCKPGETDWFTKGSDIRLDYDQNTGEARHATVVFKGTPIAYAPYFTFPLSSQRKSGFLSPTFTSSTRTGFDLALPYYWNIAPNYDATITPRIMTKRGLQLGTEFRYLGAHQDSRLQFELLGKDEQAGTRRYAYGFRHTQNLGRGLSALIDWNGVSDDEYFTDLSSRVVQTSQRQLPRQFELNYNASWWNARLLSLRYQTLNPGGEIVVAHPYFMEPQLSFNARLPEWQGLEAQFFGQYTRFAHPSLETGNRLVVYPQITFSFTRPGFYLKSKLGVHSTQYRLSERAPGLPDSLRRTLPILTLDAGLTFERETRLFGSAWLQTLEPRLFYLHIPYRDQGNFPLFDTSLADFNFAQIFSENRFSGYDRMNNANQLTAALTTRLIDPHTGAERLRAVIGQRYHFADPKVGLPGERLYRDKYSDFLAAFTGQVAPRTYVDMAMEYDFNAARTMRFTLGSRYQPTRGKVISIAYRYNRGSVADFRDTMDQIDVAGQWALGGRWYAVGRYNYAFDSSRLVEGIAGVEYNAGCWTARFVAQRLESTAGSPNTSIFFQLELNDFGQIGSNPIQMLRRSVPGYSKINELPSGFLPEAE
ncbi:MAG: LPS-assembly protein LptD [Zoogloeaceae bacterium]|jgi:LPS-assembly protein|nr:LPS-assembly protein LptD [Zoogloeaceae bacterium]